MIRNRTPHALHVHLADGSVRSIGVSGPPARVGMTTLTAAGDVDGLPVVRQWSTGIVDLPDPEPGVAVVVSSMVADELLRRGIVREDVYVPDDLVRGPDGTVVGCRRLAQRVAPTATDLRLVAALDRLHAALEQATAAEEGVTEP